MGGVVSGGVGVVSGGWFNGGASPNGMGRAGAASSWRMRFWAGAGLTGSIRLPIWSGLRGSDSVNDCGAGLRFFRVSALGGWGGFSKGEFMFGLTNLRR
jgi:hypothetical protein